MNEPISRIPITRRRLIAGLCLAPVATTIANRGEAQGRRVAPMTISPDKTTGVYGVGDTVHWTLEWKGETDPPPTIQYTVKSGGLKEVKTGELTLTNKTATLETKLDAPGTVLVEARWQPTNFGNRAVGGAVAAPEKIGPAVPAPADFDTFWKEKIAELKKVPLNPKLETGESEKPGVAYSKVTLDNIRGTHINGQIARPETGEKFPALLIVQWAGVYGLQKSWVTGRAAEGWLALNIEPHDLPIDQPESFYREQNSGPLRNYWAIGNDDRDTSYFLRMYLSCYQAVEYLKSRPDWDGKTIVVQGESQGGQQALMLAGLYPEAITACLANVPAGCDMLGPDAGTAPGFPRWYYNVDGKDPKKVREASRYFDIVNFARRIKCPTIVGLGLRDETCPPASILAATNQITAPKEVIILPKAGHQNENGTHAPYGERAYGAWLPALRQGKPAPVVTVKYSSIS